MTSSTIEGGGFAAMLCWRQSETYSFLFLQIISALLAFVISERDREDRQ
jgi:hypothetical protein